MILDRRPPPVVTPIQIIKTGRRKQLCITGAAHRARALSRPVRLAVRPGDPYLAFLATMPAWPAWPDPAIYGPPPRARQAVIP
jgi:hypothetical protein